MELLQKNYWDSVNFAEEDSCDPDESVSVETQASSDLIKQEQSVSPRESGTEHDMYIIKYEETEPTEPSVQVIDLQISKDESSDYNDNNFDQSNSVDDEL